MIIDSHQHFWQLARGDYTWITPKLKSLYRDFYPQDLQSHLVACGIQGTILVQAAPTLEETYFLLSIAKKNEFIKGVVGWADMEAENAPTVIGELAKNRAIVGIRPMIADIADSDWMLSERLTPAFKRIAECNLTFDALIQPRHIKNLTRLLARHPNLKIVVDHAAKPAIKNNQFEPWASDLASLAKNSQVYCKLSGLVTEAGRSWTYTDLKPYIDHIVYCFGAKRILWASDWPLLTVITTYFTWHELCQKYIDQYFPLEKASVFGKTAAKVYGLAK
jgi:L-fuconolactonase